MEYTNATIREITPLQKRDCFYIVDRHKAEFTYPTHSHEEYELNFLSNAAGLRRRVGDSSEVTAYYDLVLIAGCDLQHVWEQHECASQDVREITIQFSPGLLTGLIHKTQFAVIRQMLDKAQVGISFPLPVIMRVYSLLNKLVTEQRGFYSVMNFLSILYELAVHHEEAKMLSSTSTTGITTCPDSQNIRIVQKYINEKFREDLKLDQLSKLVHMEPAAFGSYFKLRSGKSISDYIIDVRLGHAVRLLLESNMNVSEICYACGFNNVSNFNRLFKKRKHFSPKEFKDSQKKRKVII